LWNYKLQVTRYIVLWLISLMPAVQDTVVVEGMGLGVGSPSKTDQVHYPVKVVRLGPESTSKEMFLPLAVTKEKD
jgi:hypothetical protein